MIDLIAVDDLLAGAAAPVGTTANLSWVVLGAVLTLLAAAGVWLIHESGQRSRVGGTALLCLSLAVLAFFTVGFALAMGGADGIYAGLGPLPGLGSEWMPRGEGWGLLGRQGFFLAGASYEAGVYALFLFQSLLVVMAVVIAVIPWLNRTPRLVPVLYTLLFAGLLYPAFANWVWGGGWLARLGQTRELGHGLVDFAGSGVVQAAGGLALLGALLALRRSPGEDVDMTAADVRALAGVALAAVGWMGCVAGSTYVMGNLPLAIAAANVLIAVISAGTVGLLYTWFVAGEPYLTVGAHACLAGLVAIAAGAPFFPAWAASVVGAVAGLLVPFGGYLLARLTGNMVTGSLVAVHGLGGIWGLLAVGLLANGRYGAGWNGVGEQSYLGVASLGITGIFPGLNLPADSGQLTAQIVGVGALFIFPVVTFLVVGGLSRLVAWWQGVRGLTMQHGRMAAEPTTEAESSDPPTSNDAGNRSALG